MASINKIFFKIVNKVFLVNSVFVGFNNLDLICTHYIS